MATCPRCKGHLTDGHHCPSRTGRLAIEIVAAALAGGIAAWLLLALFDPRGQATDMDVATFLIGACVGVGINRALRP